MILVLPPDPEPRLLERLSTELAALGCGLEVSPGPEQTLVAVGGKFDPEKVKRAVQALPEVDLIQLQTDRQYRQARRRRGFLSGLIIGFGSLTAAVLLLPVIFFLLPPERPLVLSGPQPVVSVERFELGTARKLRVRGLPIIVMHDLLGRFHAVSGECSYPEPCQLEWSVSRQQLLCPCHAGVFDVAGNVVQGLANIPLTRFDVSVRKGVLYVEGG